MAHEGITQILEKVCLPKIMEILAFWFKSKSPTVRLRVASYYQIALQSYTLDVISKSK